MLELDTKLVFNKGVIQSPNLTDRFGDDDLNTIGELCFQGYQRDLASRTAWERRMDAALDLAMQVQKEKTFPWPGASNVVFPLVTIAALQFSARAYSNIIQGTEIFKFRPIGFDPKGDLRQVADRIGKHMSWQVLEQDMSWEEQHDRLLINLAIVGCNFIKSYYSGALKHNVSELVHARDFVIDYYAKSVEDCVRKTQRVPLYRNELHEKMMMKTFRNLKDDDWFNEAPKTIETNPKVDNRRGQMPPPAPDEDQPYMTLEQHRFLDLDGDGYAEPYIVTIEESSHKVLRLVARVDREEDVERSPSKEIIRINPTEYFTKYSFIPAPDGGIYDIGFGVLLGPLNESVNTGINQILDCGTMGNSSGGFLGRGAKIRGGVYTMSPWEWKRVDSTGDDLRKSMVPLPVRDPSNVMYQVIALLINYTDRVAGTTDTLVGENPGQNTPAETTRNMTEQGMKVFNVIHKRVWRSMKEEAKKLFKLNAMYLRSSMKFGSGNDTINAEDYASNADLVVPAADPNLTSDGQRVQQAAIIGQRALGVPGYSIPDVEKNFLKALRVENIDTLYPGPDKVPPLPNPKVQVEQLKMQAKRADLQWKKQEFVIALMEERKEAQARIAKLEAEAMAVIAGVSAEEKALRLKAFDSAVSMMKNYHDALTARIEAMQKGEADGDESDGEGGGGKGTPPKARGTLPGMEASGSYDGLLPSSQGMEAGANGAMGGGTV